MAQIKNEQQYKAMIARIDALFFETEEYEKEHFPILPPSLPETMAAHISDAGMTQKEAAALLGMSAPRLCAILGGKVQPTFEQARVIASRLHIDPAIVLA